MTSLPRVKTINDFEESLDKLQQSYIREAGRLKRQVELSQTQEEIEHDKIFCFTPVRQRENVTLQFYLNKVQSHKNRSLMISSTHEYGGCLKCI